MFYTESGQRLSIQEFINHYEPYYFIGSKTPRIRNKTSRFVENEIEKLLAGDVGIDDMPLIIAWKVGYIDHAASTRSIIYKGDFEETLTYDERFIKNIDVRPMLDKLSKQFSEIKQAAQTDPDKAYEKLDSIREYGVGPVKLLTLLYFLSQGKSPIYDQFAEIAVDAYLSDTRPDNEVRYTGLPGTVTGNLKRFKAYKDKLDSIFHTDDYRDRSIDRALWVYGHWF